MNEDKLKLDYLNIEIGLYTDDQETASQLRDAWCSRKPVEFQGLTYIVTKCGSVPKPGDEPGYWDIFRLRFHKLKNHLKHAKVSVTGSE